MFITVFIDEDDGKFYDAIFRRFDDCYAPLSFLSARIHALAAFIRFSKPPRRRLPLSLRQERLRYIGCC